jgi:hypothetical protein
VYTSTCLSKLHVLSAGSRFPRGYRKNFSTHCHCYQNSSDATTLPIQAVAKSLPWDNAATHLGLVPKSIKHAALPPRMLYTSAWGVAMRVISYSPLKIFLIQKMTAFWDVDDDCHVDGARLRLRTCGHQRIYCSSPR